MQCLSHGKCSLSSSYLFLLLVVVMMIMITMMTVKNTEKVVSKGCLQLSLKGHIHSFTNIDIDT